MSWRELLAASREGSESVRAAYLRNAGNMAILTGICYLFWYMIGPWIFPEFNPFSYWNKNGNFWEHLVPVSMPAIAYAIFLGQLDWFSDDREEEGTIISENMFFKGIISFCAGLFEELLHRGVLIWAGLIIVYLSNLMFIWLLALVLLAIYVEVQERIYSKLPKLALLVFFIAIWLFIKEAVKNNPIHMINGFIFEVYQWIAADNWKLYLVYSFLMFFALSLTIDLVRKSGRSANMRPEAFMLRIAGFAALAAYVMPKAVASLGNLPIIPQGVDEWTVLLYIGAVMWSNVQFGEGHKYQGPSGVLHSHVMGFYMVYIAFKFGLAYAIAVHFLIDLFIFGSEHAVQIIKSRRNASQEYAY